VGATQRIEQHGTGLEDHPKLVGTIDGDDASIRSGIDPGFYFAYGVGQLHR
jgi:hypothetical protein